MPQLDQATYFSQFFWLVVFLFGYYAIVVRNFLPKYSRILKVRTKKIRLFSSNQPEETRSTFLANIPQSRESLLADSLHKSRQAFVQSYQKTHEQITQIIQGLEQNVLRAPNISYLTRITEFGLGQRVLSNDVDTRGLTTNSALNFFDANVIARATNLRARTTRA